MKLDSQVRSRIKGLLKGRDRSRVLLKAFKENREEFELLLYGFCEVLAKKYTSFTGYDLEDCHTEAYLYSLNKIYAEGRGKSFDPERGTPFASFIYTFIRNGVSLYYYHYNRRMKKEMLTEWSDLNGAVEDGSGHMQTYLMLDDNYGENIKYLVSKEKIIKIKTDMRKTLEAGNVDGRQYTPLELAYVWKVYKEQSYVTL